MPLDPNIILQGAQPPPQYGPTPQQMMSMQELALRMRQLQQQQQGVNTLRELYSDPDNLGTGGLLNDKAVAKLFQTNPELGFKYQGYASQAQLRATQQQGAVAKTVQEAGTMFSDLSGKSRNYYDDLIKNGASDSQARQQTQEKIYGPGVASIRASGLVSPDQAQRFPSAFDPALAGAVAQTLPQAQAASRAQRSDSRAERSESVKEANLPVWTGVGPDKKPITWQYTPDGPVDPNTRIAVDTSKVTNIRKVGNTTGVDPNSPEADATAEAIANYQQAPLTGYALRAPGAQEVMSKVMARNPDYQATRYPEVAKAMRDFGTGPQGNATRSLNVAIDHLDSLNELVGALKNGDVALINRVANVLKSELNLSTAPTTFEAAKSIIGSEVAKAVVGGASALGDREEARKPIDKANSPEILNDVIGEYKRLMAGQLHGLERQYQDATGFGPDSKFSYRKKLDPRTIAELERATPPNAQQSGGQPGNPATAPIPPPNPATAAQPTGAGTNGIVPAGAQQQRAQQVTITPQMSDEAKRKAWGDAQPGTLFKFPDGSVALKQ